MSKTNLTYPKFTQEDMNNAKLELLQQVHKTLYPIILSFECLELEMEVNNALSNIHKEHNLG